MSSCDLIQSHLFLAVFILVLPYPVLPHHDPECSVQGHHGQEWVYTAPPRFVPIPPVDPNLQAEFYRLFTSHDNDTKETVKNEQLPPGITQNELDFIARVCPKKAFFYSLSPQHAIARALIQQYFTAQPTPRDVLKVARMMLYNHDVNPKIWYYALVGTALEREDMSGLNIAQPLDTMPDMFLPAPILREALSRYSPGYAVGQPFINGPYGGGGPAGQGFMPGGGLPGPGGYPGFGGHWGLSSNVNETKVPQILNETKVPEKRDLSTEESRKKRYAFGPPYPQHNLHSDAHHPLHPEVHHPHLHPDAHHNVHPDAHHPLHPEVHHPHLHPEAHHHLHPDIHAHPDTHHPHHSHECIYVNGSIGAVNGIENKLWYFREDLMVNQFHWYWHQNYPINATRHGDRRAELFVFLHHNIVARYNAERLSNGLPRTVVLPIQHGVVVEDGYQSQIVDMNSGKFWTPRKPGVALTDILHENDPDHGTNIFLKDVHDLYEKLMYSIRDGHLVGVNLNYIPIKSRQGMDIVGNTIEASQLSVNPQYYSQDGIHNLGHQVLGLCADPQFIARVPTGIMLDTAVTMRDPVFYTYHAWVDHIFHSHKRTLPPYQLYEGDFPLVWQGVSIVNFEIMSNFPDGHANHLRTFFTTDRFPLEGGIDNSIHSGQVHQDICAVHLNHEPFTFKITVNVNPCVHTASSQGTIRIFMAPRFDEHGHRFPFKVQRRLMFQLDSFPVQLRQGKNLILRRSQDSSLTKPWPASLRQQAFGGGAGGGGGEGGEAGAADYCGCGWPRHLLIPKGNAKGLPFDFFVMITNYDHDIVQNTPEDLNIPESCTSPHIFCGVPYRRFPDARPMGYPFDRLPYDIPMKCKDKSGLHDVVCKMMGRNRFKMADTLEEYVHPIPNMATRPIVIQHVETLVH